ncbi:hypothetical protein [Methanobacterium sp. ACI-7]|uniref:hypothetical protein n=1 Tax=unclassified Methanobacterium TaxID=2627676 RepID=UPI0039C4B183
MVEEVKEKSGIIENINEPSRTLELVFGIIGGIFGLIGGIAAIMIGNFGEAF